MAEPPRHKPKITINPPKDVQGYSVYEHQLQQIEQGHRQLSRHESVATTSLTICISALIALLTANPSEVIFVLLACLASVGGTLCFYAAWHWWNDKGTIPRLLAEIRRREEMQPQAQPDAPPAKYGTAKYS